jgi:folate-binding Fe-S cluster repair protein YgfZ
MLQTHVHGADRVAFMESLVVADVDGLKDNQGTEGVNSTIRGTMLEISINDN